MIILLMGVSGSGKTTVGRLLASELGWDFLDADDYHPRTNVEKMSRGEPLTDEDRRPWLETLQKLILKARAEGKDAVLGCSALKRSYREELVVHADTVKLVYLRGSYDLIRRRMQGRSHHFMKADMLKSQFKALEEPAGGIAVDVDDTPENIVKNIRAALSI